MSKSTEEWGTTATIGARLSVPAGSDQATDKLRSNLRIITRETNQK